MLFTSKAKRFTSRKNRGSYDPRAEQNCYLRIRSGGCMPQNIRFFLSKQCLADV